MPGIAFHPSLEESKLRILATAYLRFYRIIRNFLDLFELLISQLSLFARNSYKFWNRDINDVLKYAERDRSIESNTQMKNLL